MHILLIFSTKFLQLFKRESEFEAKEDAKKSAQEKHMAKVIADFNRRKW